MGIYEDRQIHTKTGFRPIKLQESRSGPHTNRTPSNNVKYEILKLRLVMDPISDAKKTMPRGTYAGRQLLSIVEGIIELNQFEIDDQVTKTNKSKGITEMIINLDELNNSVNLKDGRTNNELLTYHVTDDKDFTHFEPQTPQYRKLL